MSYLTAGYTLERGNMIFQLLSTTDCLMRLLGRLVTAMRVHWQLCREAFFHFNTAAGFAGWESGFVVV
jgi:hypothetical protein